MTDNNKKTVLITGATSGIGKALAHEFASNKYDIVAVARNEDQLKKTTEELKDQHGIKVFTVSKDLARDGAARELYDEVKQFGRTINVLLNDAAVGQRGNFVDIAFEKYSELIHLNTLSVAHFTRLYLREMTDRNEGKILQLGSIAGF